MKWTAAMRRLRRCTLVALVPGCFVAGCNRSNEPASKPSPARLERTSDEASLTTVTLSEAAERRLGITTARVERRSVPRRRTFGGIVEVPPAGAVVVSAPVAGALERPAGTSLISPGSPVEAGQPVFLLKPLLSPDRYVPTPAERAQIANVSASLAAARAVAEGDLEKAEAEVEAARIALARAEQLLEDGAGSERAADEARVALKVAEANRDAARRRREALDQLTLDSRAGDAQPIPMTAPFRGILRSVSVASGEIVASGTQLFEVVKMHKLWIRVPVYVGQADQVDAGAEVVVGNLSGLGAQADSQGISSNPADGPSRTRRATPIDAPPSADPAASTVDLYYAIDNDHDRPFHPGERVGVTIPLRGERESMVVPWGAVLHDIHGGTWVYVKTGERSYRRSRVQLRYVVDELAVLVKGAKPDDEVVVEGAAELFGTEFGAGK